jgi:hypothetical protein
MRNASSEHGGNTLHQAKEVGLLHVNSRVKYKSQYALNMWISSFSRNYGTVYEQLYLIFQSASKTFGRMTEWHVRVSYRHGTSI